MSEIFSFENIRSVVDNIAKEHNITKYRINVKADDFTGDNYTSKIVHAQIVPEGGHDDTINLLIKLTTSSKDLQEKFGTGKFFETELLAYNAILPALRKYQDEYKLPEENKFKYAKFFKGAQEYMKEYVIMEDLSYKGYKVYGKANPLDYKHSKKILQTLANIHAASFAMQAKEPEKFAKLIQGMRAEQNYPDAVIKMVKSIPSQVVPHIKSDKRKKVIASFTEKAESMLHTCLKAKLTAPYNTICHGDLWNNNMLFKEENGKLDVVFLDYQLMRYASPATDIMYNIYLCTEKSFRDEHLSALCGEYYVTLSEALKYYGCDANTIYPRHIFDKHLLEMVPFGIIFGLITCPVFLGKAGEEKNLEELMGDLKESKFTTTEPMIRRLEGMADDIIKYKLCDES